MLLRLIISNVALITRFESNPLGYSNEYNHSTFNNRKDTKDTKLELISHIISILHFEFIKSVKKDANLLQFDESEQSYIF